MSYISIKNIVKNFKEVKALKNVSLEVEKGEFITLLGPSGCGKSTLLRIIAGLETQNSGELYINGKNLANTPANKRNLGMVFQQYSLFPNMTVAQNVAFGLKLKKIPTEQIHNEVSNMLKLVGLDEKSRSYPDELSGGQQQRVALARALVVKPDVLLLDEPLSALDAKIRLSLRSMIKNIQMQLKTTTLFVTHDQEEALSISDRIYVMESGDIVQHGTPQQIYMNPKDRFVASFLGTYNFMDAHFFGEDVQDGEVLIRPEHVEVLEPGAAPSKDVFHGHIRNIYFLGNISRLEVIVNETPVLVDALNREDKTYRKGQEISILIPQEKYFRIK